VNATQLRTPRPIIEIERRVQSSSAAEDLGIFSRGSLASHEQRRVIERASRANDIQRQSNQQQRDPRIAEQTA